jgi:hypothetical protein
MVMAPTKQERKKKSIDKTNESKKEKDLEITTENKDEPKTIIKQTSEYDFDKLNFKLVGRLLAFSLVIFLTFATRLYNLSLPRHIW